MMFFFSMSISWFIFLSLIKKTFFSSGSVFLEWNRFCYGCLSAKFTIYCAKAVFKTKNGLSPFFLCLKANLEFADKNILFVPKLLSEQVYILKARTSEMIIQSAFVSFLCQFSVIARIVLLESEVFLLLHKCDQIFTQVLKLDTWNPLNNRDKNITLINLFIEEMYPILDVCVWGGFWHETD